MNQNSFEQILDKVKAQQVIEAEELNEMEKSEVVKRFFITLIQSAMKSSSTRHLTVETINRYIFTLNAL